MKRFQLTLAFFLIFGCLIQAQNNIGINDNNSSPNASAMLDVYSTSKGMLVPRVALTGTSSASPITAPAASLLIYNTATTGDVTPGYYYWNGTSKWVRLITGADPKQSFNTVSKSASTTLLKTENMVFASGDITLTLPVITSADDGLEISVKNIGTYTNLVTVVPQSGKTIDAVTSSPLMRWIGKTYVATGTNWIVKEKETRTDNFLEVSATGSFTTIAEAIAFLNLHMTSPTVVRLGGGNYTVAATQTISLPHPLTIQGLSYGETTITPQSGFSGSPLFSCASECYFKMLSFSTTSSGTGNDAIRFTGSGIYHEVKDCSFSGFNKGIVSTNNNDLWVFETDFENCTGAGIEVAAGTASGGSLKVSECDYLECAKGISLLSASSEGVSIINCTFYNTTSGTDIGIYYYPASFTNFASMFISNNAWNNQGSFISGFDFSRTDGRDANAFVEGNLGIESNSPHARINVLNNNSTTTCTTANSWYKCNWTSTSVYTCNLLTNNNRITYLPVNAKDVVMWISGNISCSNSSRTISIGVVKNAVSTIRYGETTLRTPSSSTNQPYQFSTVVYLSDIVPGDYFELFVSSTSSGDIMKIQDLNWVTLAQ